MNRMNVKRIKDTISILSLSALMCLDVSCSTDNKEEIIDSDKDKEEIKYPEFPKYDEVLAFPTAEGYGKNTIGGRGGKVYEVTNLNDSGTGSLRAAVEAKGARIVVFRVSGTIDLKKNLRISNPYITIAGQTAPGDGICLKHYQLQITADEVIIRHIRVRPGDEAGLSLDAVGGEGCHNIILDHVSTSWSEDECMSIYRCHNLTIQWCLIGESLYMSTHISGGFHAFGGIWGSDKATYHHNLFAHHVSRTPRWSPGTGYNDYRNNVVYNWAYNNCYGGEKVSDAEYPEKLDYFCVNMVSNYYKQGPATRPDATYYRIANPSFEPEKEINGKWYIANNYMVGNAKVTADNWDGGVQISYDSKYLSQLRLDKPWDAMAINEESAEDAYKSVLKGVGAFATMNKRDAIDTRILKDVSTGTATYEGPGYKLHGKGVKDKSVPCGIIDKPSDVGGWPELKSEEAPIDTDHDGMPDEWEKKYGLNPNDATDGSKKAPNGYTYLENYLNSLCGE